MKKTNKRSLAAKKANQTRQIRLTFERAYPYTYDIAALVLQGKTTEEICNRLGIWEATVAAVRANLHRDNCFSALAHACHYAR